MGLEALVDLEDQMDLVFQKDLGPLEDPVVLVVLVDLVVQEDLGDLVGLVALVDLVNLGHQLLLEDQKVCFIFYINFYLGFNNIL